MLSKTLNPEKPVPNELDEYPVLQNLVRGYFHQDYDYDGQTPDGVIAEYKAENEPARTKRLVEELQAFIRRYSASDAELSAAFERVFTPEDTFYNYEGRTTREGLEKIVRLLS